MKKAVKQSVMIQSLNFCSILAMLGIVFSFLCFVNVRNKVNNANTDRYDLTYNANRYMNGSAYLTNEVRAYAATGSEEHYNNYWNEINNLKNREIGVANLKEIGITSEEQAMIDSMSSLSNQLVPLETLAMENVKAGKMDLAVDYVYGQEYSDSIAKINEIKSNILASLDHRSEKEIKRLEGVSTLIKSVCFLFIFAVVFMQGAVILYVRKKMIRPIVAIRDEMTEFSKGNLSSDFPLEPDTSEIGMLTYAIKNSKIELKRYVDEIAKAMEKMSNRNFDLSFSQSFVGDFKPIEDSIYRMSLAMSSSLSQMSNAANQVANSSDQVANGAQVSAQGATEQANSIEHLTATITALFEQLQQNADTSDKASEMAKGAASAITDSNEQMQQLMTSMYNIDSQSKEIRKIIKTIEDIAFQTNILALNAAVEAARAGAAGKGFAVVADEVRSLAAKSAEAAQDTTQLIESSITAISQGVKLAQATADDLLQVVSGAVETTDLIQKITNATKTQAQALSQITSGLDQISSVVQQSSAVSEESAAASQELSGQAQMLQSLIKQFKVKQ